MKDQMRKSPGRKPTANPRNIRVTFLVTPAELETLQAAALQSFEGNLSAMARSIVFKALATMSVAKE